MNVTIRHFRSDDVGDLRRLTIEGFAGVTLEENIEQALGHLAGHDWRWRKARHIDEDVAACPEGVFVAEVEGQLVGYITARIDHEAGKGRIPNLAVDAQWRGHGIGRRLIEHVLEFFRQQKLEYAVIETMAQNPVGQRLYPACGFIEVAQQIHYARRL